MPKDALDYHRSELLIAKNPEDPRRILPDIGPSHRRILDVGCGAGQTLIASNLAETVFTVGTDVDHSALRYGLQEDARILFICAQGEALPFRDQTFDLVICRVALPYMHVHRALSEMARVLDHGGDLWLVLHPLSMTRKELFDNVRKLNLKATVYRLWVLVNGLLLHLLNRQLSWPLQPGRYESWQTVAGTKRILLKVGFDDVRITCDNHFVVTARKP